MLLKLWPQNFTNKKANQSLADNGQFLEPVLPMVEQILKALILVLSQCWKAFHCLQSQLPGGDG